MAQQGKEFYDESTETMSPQEREGHYNQRLAWLVEYAYNNAPAIKEKLDNAGIDPAQIRSIADLERIPTTSRDELIERQRANPPFGGFLAIPLDKVRRIHLSPGPEYEPTGPEGFGPGMVKTFYAAGFRKGDIVLNTISFHLVMAGFMADDALTSLEATSIHTGPGNNELQVQMIRDLKATCYCGTASALKILIETAERLGYHFSQDFAIRCALLGGEMVPPSLRRSFEQDYGISVCQFYALADVGSIAYECRQKSGMHIAEEVLVEIVDPETGRRLAPGEIGEIVVTSFSETLPLIRYATGDLSSYTDEPCPCGRTSNRLLGIAGRVGEATKVRGMFIHPKQVEQVAAKCPQISRFQVVVTRSGVRDKIGFNIELTEEAVDKQRLIDDLQADFRDVCRLRIDDIEFVSKGTIPEEHKTIIDQRRWE